MRCVSKWRITYCSKAPALWKGRDLSRLPGQVVVFPELNSWAVVLSFVLRSVWVHPMLFGAKGTTDVHTAACLLLCLIQPFVSDPEVSCLLSAATDPWRASLCIYSSGNSTACSSLPHCPMHLNRAKSSQPSFTFFPVGPSKTLGYFTENILFLMSCLRWSVGRIKLIQRESIRSAKNSIWNHKDTLSPSFWCPVVTITRKSVSDNYC